MCARKFLYVSNRLLLSWEEEYSRFMSTFHSFVVTGKKWLAVYSILLSSEEVSENTFLEIHCPLVPLLQLARKRVKYSIVWTYEGYPGKKRSNALPQTGIPGCIYDHPNFISERRTEVIVLRSGLIHFHKSTIKFGLQRTDCSLSLRRICQPKPEWKKSCDVSWDPRTSETVFRWKVESESWMELILF